MDSSLNYEHAVAHGRVAATKILKQQIMASL